MYNIFDKQAIISLKQFVKNHIFVADSGHGWLTGGKRSIDGSLRENEFNTALEDKLTFLWDSSGMEYYQLAAGWKDEGLKRRKGIENRLFREAQAKNKKLIGISLHADAFKQDISANGFCVYYYKKGVRESKKGKLLAMCIADSIIRSDIKNNHIIRSRHNNGIKGHNFYMLRETLGTWVLIENAFMTNARDLKYLKDDGFRNDRAYAIFEGIIEFLKINI